ncbi:MAG TPA: FAD-dependent oxidoreductase [Thermoanaerobaculia bacterium]
MSARHACDVAVVGGGPAGLAAALAARRSGLDVVVLEPRPSPIDKACGEGLMPSALAALAALGVDLGGAGRAFRGVAYVSGATVAAADFPGGASGRGLRRTELHAALVAAAARAGVEIRAERAEALTARGVAAAGGELAARWVVGADGLRSRVRHWAGLARGTGGAPPRFGLRRHLALAPWSERVEIVFGDSAEAYVTPLAADEIGVALLWRGVARGFDDLLATRFPAGLRRRLAGARVTARDLGTGPFRQATRGVARGRVALVGDAAGSLDALTGEGLACAFEEALALGPALALGDLVGYARASARLRRVPETVTRLALLLARHPALRRRAVAALAADPALFSRLIGLLGARGRLRELGGGAVARFGARLVVPALGAAG